MKQQLTWREAISQKRFLIFFVLGWIGVFTVAYISPLFLAYIQARKGVVLDDFILKMIPPTDVSTIVFIINYLLIGWTVIRAFQKPLLLMHFQIAFCLFYIFRFSTIYLVPLDPPDGLIILLDPFAKRVIYDGDYVTKDLFFSGHVGFLALVCCLLPTRLEKRIGIVGTIIMTVLILLQHVHYTIDIIVSPFFAYLSYFLAKKILIKINPTDHYEP